MTGAVRIRPVDRRDADSWLGLRRALWPEGSESEHASEIAAFVAGRSQEPAAVLLAEDSGDVVGLAELSIRPYAEGCHTSRVAYLDGWYVSPQARRRGIGRALIQAAERWGREQGCSEFASDAQPHNATSLLAHRAVGFEDAGMVQCFHKKL